MASYYERFFSNTTEEIKGILEHWVTDEAYRLSAKSYHTTVQTHFIWLYTCSL